LKTNKPTLKTIGTSGRRDKDMKWSTFWITRSKVMVTRSRSQVWRPSRAR